MPRGRRFPKSTYYNWIAEQVFGELGACCGHRELDHLVVTEDGPTGRYGACRRCGCQRWVTSWPTNG